MRPAFSSTKQAGMFTLLLLALLAGPWLAGKRFLPPRPAAYAAEGFGQGTYPWLHNQIFEETNDIDMVFMGSSHLLWGIDTPYVEKQLDEQSGRKSTVRTVCWMYRGFDALYFIAKDLLDHRKVGLLVFCNEQKSNYPRPQPKAYRWFRFGDNRDDLAGVPLGMQLSLYSSCILGLPRNFLSLARQDGPMDPRSGGLKIYTDSYRTPGPFSLLGSITSGLSVQDGTNFIDYHPANGVSAADVCVYDPQTRTNFEFSAQGVDPAQLCFLKKLVRLARSHGTKLAVLHTPEMNELDAARIPERACWPEVLDPDIRLIGIPGAKLFSGMTDSQKRRLFYDHDHLNRNGQEYFTPLVTPALLQSYETRIKN